MKKTQTLVISNRTTGFNKDESTALSKCFQAYSNNCAGIFCGQMISSLGFEQVKKYAYINLENGVTICSMFDGDVMYFIDGIDEEMFTSYGDAKNNL